MPQQPFSLRCPLPEGDLLFESMSSTAGLSIAGTTKLSLLSRKGDIDPNALLGKPMQVTLELRDEVKRHVHGYVARFSSGGHRGRFFTYQATVMPWLWFMSRTSDCRIFQDMTVPDIVKAVFEDHPIANYEFKLFRSYRTWVYCVQYRESDFNFVSRLLEQEGIYWYFEHSEGAHKLVLVDASSAHDEAAGYDALPYFANVAQAPPDTEYVNRWQVSREVTTGKVVITDYNFEKPSGKLEVEAVKARAYDLSDGEAFDYPGEYMVKADGQHYIDTRIDEHQSRFEVFQGSSNAYALDTGRLFGLKRHPRDDQNAQYLLASTSLECRDEGHESGSGAGVSVTCDFTAIPAAQQFRPRRSTPKPFVQGAQTAVVVGPAGEEIFTDKYGRVKVQFHWDRLGKRNEKSSCWVRVSYPWAGKNFGAIHIPRIGQEVIVDFLEGDPDQPIIVGRVYNAEQMPPWELPANATQSGILTRSSKGGGYGNANAIRFEDKQGAEQLWIHAEKNQDIEVENDETHSVGHDRTKTIDNDETSHIKHDRTETVDNNETITIGVDRTESVGSNETITIGSNRTISVGASETASVALQRTHAVGVNETIAIGAAQEVAIGAFQSVSIGANQDVNVGANQSTSVGANQSNTIGSNQSNKIGGGQTTSVGKDRSVTVGAKLATSVSADESRSVGGGRTTSVGKDDALTVAKNLVIDAGDAVTIKTGSASISMKKDGTITIKGKDIKIEGSGKINVKASSDVVVKGSKILQN
jgi:type VI secretion system secreted protein VgrG